MPDILGERQNLRPYDYPIFEEMHLASIQSPWSHLEVPMANDIIDWSEISELEQRIVAGILKGFTLAETLVGCYWREVVAMKFRLPEIVMMATTFSHQETIHGRGYDHLESTLNLDTYQAFLSDPVSRGKLEFILSQLETKEDLARSLAIFSGAVEGVSLFSSFAVLLSFSKKSQFGGMAQILSWSVLDEIKHSQMGLELYKQLIAEYPELKPLDSEIYEGFDAVVENELAFIDSVFKDGDLETISKAETKDFIKYRANKKLMELRLPPVYSLTGDYQEVKHYFDTIMGKTMNDFFAQGRNGGGYSAMLTQDFTNCTIS